MRGAVRLGEEEILGDGGMDEVASEFEGDQRESHTYHKAGDAERDICGYGKRYRYKKEDGERK